MTYIFLAPKAIPAAINNPMPPSIGTHGGGQHGGGPPPPPGGPGGPNAKRGLQKKISSNKKEKINIAFFIVTFSRVYNFMSKYRSAAKLAKFISELTFEQIFVRQ